MRKSFRLLALAAGCLCSPAWCSSLFAAERLSEDFSKGWRFLREDTAGAESPDFQGEGDWQNVDLPHTWNIKDTFDDEPGYYRGVGWYRRAFAVPESWRGKRIVLRFEAACQVATVWVDGRLLGEHKGAWTPFEFDVTRLVKPGTGKNLVAVKVDNRWRRDVPPHDMDFNVMGGLHREVLLIATDPVHIVSTRVTTPKVSKDEAVAAVQIEIRNDSAEARDCEVVTTISGPGLSEPIVLTSPSARPEPGATFIAKQQTQTIAGPRLWSPDTPNLYQVVSRIRIDGCDVDAVENPLGFRWYRFDPEKGFFLNGGHLKLRGVNRHDDYPGMGWAIPKSRQIEDLKLIKQMGANFIRPAHYAQHPIVLEMCDKLGLLVWEEIPFTGEGPHRAPIVGADDFARTLEDYLRETIRRDRNHPSIIIWSLGNENTGGKGLDDWKAVAELTRRLDGIAKQEDPSRPTAVAINRPDRAKQAGLTEAVDILGLNIYAGWYSGRIEDFAGIADDFHRENPGKPIVISEYGADMERGLHSASPKRMDVSEEYGCLFHESYWRAIESRPYISGSLIWNVFDFAVERRVKGQTIPHMNQKGVFTYDRQPKDAYYFYLSQWTDEPMVHIVSHTWTQRKQGPASIRVYSNGETVELFHNGKSLGERGAAEVFTWDVSLAAGENELRAEAGRGEKRVSDVLNVRCE